MLATSNMLADIAKGGHSLKKAAPIVKKVDPKMNLLNSIRKGAGGGGLKHVEVGEKGEGGAGGGDGKNLVTYQELAAQTSKPF